MEREEKNKIRDEFFQKALENNEVTIKVENVALEEGPCKFLK
jgi:hypothetical protein